MKKHLLVKTPLMGVLVAVLLLAACKKDKYYFDGGKHDPVYKGTILQYLQQKPAFDTIAAIVKLAGLEKEFSEEPFTFFAPSDLAVRTAIVRANRVLFQNGKDTILRLDDVSPQIWRKALTNYMFSGANKLNDYYQLDIRLKAVYPGQSYYSYGNQIFNIGVIYDDINGIKYAGYRHIRISLITDPNKPLDSWISSDVSSSDIQPSNGVIHTLNVLHEFTYNNEFLSNILSERR